MRLLIKLGISPSISVLSEGASGVVSVSAKALFRGSIGKMESLSEEESAVPAPMVSLQNAGMDCAESDCASTRIARSNKQMPMNKLAR